MDYTVGCEDIPSNNMAVEIDSKTARAESDADSLITTEFTSVQSRWNGVPKEKLEDRVCAVANVISEEFLDDILWRLPVLWRILELPERMVCGDEEGVVRDCAVENCDDVFVF